MNTDIIYDPVVSLRSTTGYRLRSRWDHSDFAVSDHFADVGKTIQMLKNAGKIIDDLMLIRYTCYSPVYKGCTDAGGISSCSRWLSGATPPDLNPSESRTPAGVPAIAHHALHPHLPPLPSDLRDETPRTDPCQRVAARTPRLSRRNRQWTGCALRGRRRRGGSCPPARLAETDHLPLRFHARAEKILVQLAPGIEMPWLPLAGRLRSLHRQCFRAGLSSRLHCQSGGTPPGEIFPRGADRLSGKNGSHLRSAISRLIPPPMASFRDAGCVSCHDPVVSLRSITGYRLRSRWDHSDFAVFDHFGDFHQMIPIGTTDTGYIPSHTRNGERGPTAIGTTDAGGISSCSRWSSAATPPDDESTHTSHPGGMPACSRWSSAATPPDPNAPEFRTPAGVPAKVQASGRFFEDHFVGVNKMVLAELLGMNAEAQELEAKIAENVVELLEA